MMEKAKRYEWEPDIKSGGFGISEAVMKVAAQVIDTKDEVLVEVCKDAARKAGITDLTLIDRDSLVQYFGGESERQKFCQLCHGTHIQTDDELFDIQISKIIPLPAINLTTGEADKSAPPPFHALTIGNEELGQDFLSVAFCPLCGRKLMEETNGKE